MWRRLKFLWDNSWKNLDGSVSWANAWALLKSRDKQSDVGRVQQKMKDTQHSILQSRIIVRTRGHCAHREHELSSASNHSTQCWDYTQCTGTKTHWLSKSVNSFTFNMYETFGHAVLNPLNRFTFVHAATVNISVLTDERKMPSGFAMCFKRGLVEITPLIQIRSFMMMFFALIILLFDRNYPRQSSLHRSRSWTWPPTNPKGWWLLQLCSLEKLHCNISF